MPIPEYYDAPDRENMRKRRLILKRAAIASISALLIGAAWLSNFWLSSKSERAVGSPIDEKFRATILRAAALRETDRSIGIEINSLFKDFIDEYSLAGLRNYLNEHYKSHRGRSMSGNGEYFDISTAELKSFDRRFLYLDGIRIFFKYTDDWQSITSFRAVLASHAL